MALYVILIIVAVIMLLMLLPIDVMVRVSYNDSNMQNAVVLKYAFLTFKLYPLEIEKKKEEIEKKTKKAKKAKKEKKKGSAKATIRLIKAVWTELKGDIGRIFKYLMKRLICIKELNISAKFGTGDPMRTGIVMGTVSAAVYNAVSFIDRHMTLDNWNVSLDPDFNSECMDVGLYSVIRTRIIFALKIGIMAVILLLKIQIINRRINKNDK